MVANFWKVDPDAVYRWTFLDYLKRQEYMFIQLEMQRGPNG